VYSTSDTALDTREKNSDRWVSVFTEGDELYDAMLDDIRSAQERIRLESYILSDDVVGGQFFSELEKSSVLGCVVGVRADYAGSWGAVPQTRQRSLLTAGVQWSWSRPWSWRMPWILNRRNHRKLLIIDGRVAYVGGFNIHRESSRRAFGPSRWRDTHARFTGPLVKDAIQLFDRFPRRPRVAWPNFPGGIGLLPNNSHRCRHLLRCAFNAHFRSAQERIWLTTPYFVPDSRSQKALREAARRGVDVRVLVPAKSDVTLTTWAARASYSRMLASGIRIWEYGGRVLHAKTVLVDRSWGTIGTANFDYRSFFLNDELNLMVEERAFNARLAQQFEEDLTESAEVTESGWKRRAWYAVVVETIGWWARRWL
jgi:cardiolipin synthase A/B